MGTIQNSFQWRAITALVVAGFPCASLATECTDGPLARAGARQVLLSIGDGWNDVHGVVHRLEQKPDGSWTDATPEGIDSELGRSGLGWGTGLHDSRTPRAGAPGKREGDGRAPGGIFRLTEAFGTQPISEAVKSGARPLPYREAGGMNSCVDDEKSPYYNRMVHDFRADSEFSFTAENRRVLATAEVVKVLDEIEKLSRRMTELEMRASRLRDSGNGEAWLPVRAELAELRPILKAKYVSVMKRLGIESTENLNRRSFNGDGQYDQAIVVDHNSAQAPGGGSCIFLHSWRGTGAGTAGCTAMESSQMARTLEWADASKNPVLVQLPLQEYLRLQKSWCLPGVPENELRAQLSRSRAARETRVVQSNVQGPRRAPAILPAAPSAGSAAESNRPFDAARKVPGELSAKPATPSSVGGAASAK